MLFFFALAPLSGERNDPLPPAESSMSYGLHLMNNGDYYRAITEFKRYIFFGASSGKKEEAEYNIGACYLKGGEFRNARNSFQRIRMTSRHSRSDAAILGIADSVFLEQAVGLKPIRAYYDREDTYFSPEHYLDYLNEAVTPDRDSAFLKLSIINTLNFQKEKALYFLDRASSAGRAEGNTGLIQLKQKISKMDLIPERSETAAVLLSIIIPGAGQVYAGDVQEGLLALGVNSVFIYATYCVYTRYSKLLGIFLGFNEIKFYMGNISNAMEAVYRFNMNRRYEFRQEILKISF